MKKIIVLIIVTILLSSCSLFGKKSDDDVTKAKEELLGEQVVSNSDDIMSENTETGELDETNEEIDIDTNEPTTNVTALTSGEPLIEIEDLSDKDFYSGEFYINGKVLGNVDRIEVNFSNESSKYPTDLYKLKQYKPGDTRFKYLASSNFKTMDFGLNEYIFTAYSGETTYKIKIEINIPEKEIKNSQNPVDAISDTEILGLNDVKNLKISNNDNVSEITCESQKLTDYLVENYGFSYWNSCRDIVKGKSIGFYVLRLDGDDYYYEKHYIDYEKKTYGILLLETGTGVTKESIKLKNYELKDVSFDETLKTDKLFKN
ncbi:hypothetical protein EOM39_04125 [Candidatus Gracilibacteria bacterium]|nr:hypothetical protein [Candidatus Gracilibacteria bacterium]